jgi:hypothetical protein
MPGTVRLVPRSLCDTMQMGREARPSAAVESRASRKGSARAMASALLETPVSLWNTTEGGRRAPIRAAN